MVKGEEMQIGLDDFALVLSCKDEEYDEMLLKSQTVLKGVCSRAVVVPDL